MGRDRNVPIRFGSGAWMLAAVLVAQGAFARPSASASNPKLSTKPELSAPAGAAQGAPHSWTERALVQQYRTASPVRKSLEAARQQRSLDETLTQEQFAPRLVASGGRTTSNEKPVSPMQPTMSPIDTVQLGVQQKLRHGVQLEGSLFGNQSSTADGTLTDATKVGAKFQVQLELLKNRMGVLDTAQVETASIKSKRAELETRIANKKQEIEIRKLHWSIVANELSLALSK